MTPPLVDLSPLGDTPMLTVKILPNECGSPAGKLADAELHFTSDHLDPPLLANLDSDGHTHAAIQAAINAARVLNGLKLIGFAIWERRGGNGRNVTFPCRQYSVNGERRSFALLRPNGFPGQDIHAQDRIRDLILAAYDEHVAAGDAR